MQRGVVDAPFVNQRARLVLGVLVLSMGCDATDVQTLGALLPADSEGVETSGGLSESGSTEDGSSTGSAPAECGDGVVSGAEGCDEGDGNRLAAGACAPDCSGVIETRRLVQSAAFTRGMLGDSPVAFADGLCPRDTRALFAVPGDREPDSPIRGAIDWPLTPYTHYVREDGAEIWTTDATAQLGIRDGVLEPLVHPPERSTCFGLGCVFDERKVVTGLRGDGSVGVTADCAGWSSAEHLDEMSVGDARSLTAYLEHKRIPCDWGDPDAEGNAAGNPWAPEDAVWVGGNPRFYCVENGDVSSRTP